MLAPEQKKPVMRSYLAATQGFSSGPHSPRQFLDESLALFEIWEPRIGAFVCTNLPAARAAADQSTARWRAGKPLSPIDGMPVGIKDIIETVDMPTEMGSPLYSGWRSREGLGERAGVARSRRGHRRQDGDDRVRGIRAARHAQSVERRAYAGRIVDRLGGFGRGRRRERRARHPGDRLDHSPGELLRLRRLQAERQRAQSRRQPRLPQPELHRRARRVIGG